LGSGFFALIWFLIRVIPKPTRANYPCQRAAFPLASAFIAYFLGGGIIVAAFKRARLYSKRARYLLAGFCIAVGIGAAFLITGMHSLPGQAAQFIPPDPCNSPIGIAQGIFPGLVVWDHDPNATHWSPEWNNRTDIFYWDDEHTDQNAVDEMMSNCVRWLTGEDSDPNAWHSLFRHFNWTRDPNAVGDPLDPNNLVYDQNSVGYTPGEKIAIKPNHVEHRRLNWQYNYADLSPQVTVALLKQLVYEANVPQEDITVCDSSRYIANKTYDRCAALFPRVNYLVTNFYIGRGDDRYADPCRPPVIPSRYEKIHYSLPNIPSDNLPMPFVEADYVINLAVMKGHASAGVTLCAKNWYGSFCCRPGDAQHSTLAGAKPQEGNYRLLVDLMGHEHLGAKTMLYILDGLWGFPWHGSSSRPMRWQNTPFNNDYPSSILMSQDMVAIDSVGLDFLRAELETPYGGVDDYLHEAALANDPPSGTFYDPEADGIPLQSLGVHEHWNNPIDKQYLRNLDPNALNGIELINIDEYLSNMDPNTGNMDPNTG
jgi:hypothetical protein